jgi:thioredoxin-dependent peroxiredoxin
MPITLEEGDLAPDFTAFDESGGRVRLSDLRGSWVVLFFYPEDDTPGCTVEACGFRDAHELYRKADVVVLGVSPDSAESHRAFKRKFGLPFPLLVDQDHALAGKYGAWGPKNVYGNEVVGMTRSTFVIDPTGRLAKVFRRVQVEGHEKQVLDVVRGAA